MAPLQKISAEYLCDDFTPACPHCQSDNMGRATVDLDQLVQRWPFRSEVKFHQDGFAAANQSMRHPVVDCPDCKRPSLVTFNRHEIVLVATRTEKDERLLKETV